MNRFHSIAFALIVFLVGCSGQQSKKVAYLYVIDYSQSTEDIRKQEIGAMLEELEMAPSDASVTVLRMGYATQEIYTGLLGDTTVDEITAAAMKDASRSNPTPGTNFALMADAITAFEKRSKADQLFVRVLTDGADDFVSDQTNHASYLNSASAGASDSRLASLVFYGIKPGFREGIHTAFDGAGDKLRILDAGQLIGD